MITVKARINISGSGRGTISSVNFSPSGNNISASGMSLINKKEIRRANPFILGKSILGRGATYVKTLSFFMGSVLSDANGNFKETYTVEISGKDLTAVIFVFDKENNYHPNTVSADGNILFDDDSQFEILLSNSAQTTHTIQISNWNAPYEPLIITGIYADIVIDIDTKNFVSFKSDLMDRESSSYPSYGIISNGASLDFADFDEQALDLIKQKILHSGITVTAWVENEEASTKEQLFEMEIRELTYDNNNKQVQLALKDNLEDMQNINVPAVEYDISSRESKTAQWFYEYLFEKTNELGEYNILSFSELDEATKEILRTTVIEYPLLESENLWNSWDKLCQLCLLHMYIDKSNRVIISHGV